MNFTLEISSDHKPLVHVGTAREIKGILVTTADYGADAYKFASDKSLTLLNGGNLLCLLQKHGFKGRIDVKAAREEMRPGQH